MNSRRRHGSDKQVDAVLEYRFPGMTEDVELALIALAKKSDAEESDLEVVSALIRRFDIDIRDRDRPELWAEEPLIINYPSFAENADKLRAWVRDARAYRGLVEELDQRELFALFQIAGAQVFSRRTAMQARIDLSRFFHHPTSDAEFPHWLALPRWTMEEAVALSLGKDPRFVDAASLSETPDQSPFKTAFMQRLDVAKRFVLAKELSEHTEPTDFIRWAIGRSDFDIPQDFQEVVSRRKSRPASELVNANLRTSYLKLILGMALARYEFDPKNPKGSKVYKTIHLELLKEGISLHDDTIGDHLKEASDLFIKRYWE